MPAFSYSRRVVASSLHITVTLFAPAAPGVLCRKAHKGRGLQICLYQHLLPLLHIQPRAHHKLCIFIKLCFKVHTHSPSCRPAQAQTARGPAAFLPLA